MDLYVSNLGADNFLYYNNHDNTFTEVGEQAGVQAPWMSFATWFFDYDNDAGRKSKKPVWTFASCGNVEAILQRGQRKVS
jgi:hypothetical protein